MQGKILKAISGFYYVEYKNSIYECRAKGVFRKKNESPLVGDIVEFDIIKENTGNITKIFDRKNELVRPPIANIDLAVVVAAIKTPELSTLFIDKQLVFLESKGIETIICINKLDLGKVLDIENIYKNIGYKVIITSAKENIGIEELYKCIEGKNSVFVGNSGVGKSSLTNKLLGYQVMEEGDLSKIERGKQTTRHTELLKINDNTYIADSPGFSSFEITDIESISDNFIEFREYVNHCRYNDCNHILEDECMIKKAVSEGKIAKSRHESYCIIQKEIKTKYK